MEAIDLISHYLMFTSFLLFTIHLFKERKKLISTDGLVGSTCVPNIVSTILLYYKPFAYRTVDILTENMVLMIIPWTLLVMH